MERIVFLGAPGAGKGTQASRLAAHRRLPHLSTGELLRGAVRDGTPLGREADGHMRAGRLVPDALVLGILKERLAAPDAREGFVLDGYPRNLAQAETLASVTPLEHVLSFEIPEPLLTARLTGRRHCPECGRVYNLLTLPPRAPGVCDVDGTPLARRTDDTPEAVGTRLAVYAAETAPLLRYYEARGLLRSVDAVGAPEAVFARILDRLRLPAVPTPSAQDL